MNNMQLEFEAGNNKKYKVDGILENAVYAEESTIGQLPEFYYLVSWKSYPEEKNTWEPILAIQYLQRLVTTYYKDNLEKPTATFLLVNTALPIARPTKASTKQSQPAGRTVAPTKKRSRPIDSTITIKRAKKS